MAKTIANLALGLHAPQARFQRDMKKASGAVKGFGRTASVTSKTTRGMAASVALSTKAMLAMSIAGIGVTSVLAKGAREAVSFNRKMAEVSTIADQTSDGMSRLTDDVRDLSVALGRSPTELAAGLYQTLSSGITDAAEATRFLDVATRAAIAGVADTSEAVDLLTNVINAYGLEVKEAGRISNVAFKAVRKGKVVFSDLAKNMGKILPFGAQLNIEFEELFAAVSTLTQGGLEVEVATTAVKNVLAALLKPSKELRRHARGLGFDFSAAAVKGIGFRKWLLGVEELTKGSSEELAKLFPEIRGLTAVLALAGTQSDAFTKILANLKSETDEVGAGFRKMADSDALRLERALNKLNVEGEKLGAKTLPFIANQLEGVNAGLDNMAELGAGVAKRGIFGGLRDFVIRNFLGGREVEALTNRAVKRVAKKLPAHVGRGVGGGESDVIAPAEGVIPEKIKRVGRLPFDFQAFAVDSVVAGIQGIAGKGKQAAAIVKRAAGIGAGVVANVRRAAEAPDMRREVGREARQIVLSRMAITGVAAGVPTAQQQQVNLLEGIEDQLGLIRIQMNMFAGVVE